MSRYARMRIPRSEYLRVANYGATPERLVNAKCSACGRKITSVSRDRAFRFLREHETLHFLEHDREGRNR